MSTYALQKALREGRKIDAIKALRDEATFYPGTATLSLKSAKDIVEAVFELLHERQPAEGKGDLSRLLIEALPQGGYTVTAPGQTWGVHHEQLSAHTTKKEALAFAGRTLR